MSNYYASEHALTRHTKLLWENKPNVQAFAFPSEEKVEIFSGRGCLR